MYKKKQLSISSIAVSQQDSSLANFWKWGWVKKERERECCLVKKLNINIFLAMSRDKYHEGERDSNLDLYSWWAMCLTRAGRIPGASLKSVEKPSEWECMIIGGAGPDIKPSPACPRTVILQIVDFYFEGRMTSYKTILQCQWKFNACTV